MAQREQKQKKRIWILLRAALPAAVVLLVLALSLSSVAWFYLGRRAAAVVELSDPTAIFINAGDQEDIRYLDLGGIDLESGASSRDYVFCVRGNNVDYYKLQLAYTTNNQFSFELYTASVAASAGAVPANPESLVIYNTHDDNGVVDGTAYYYAPGGATPLAGDFLNKKTDPEILAKNNDVYHDETYASFADGSTPYANRNQYAIPLYWQTNTSVRTSMDAEFNFCDYYILRVIWNSADAKNNKETDILYIAAKNVSS